MFWHGKMFAGWYAMSERKPVALVSSSKDGNLLSSVLAHWKYKLARGSSGKKGMEALTEAMDVVRRGEADTLVITPDGPRGPLHNFKRGAFIAARTLDIPLYMVRVHYHNRFIFQRSWDQFELPLPFSRVSIKMFPINLSSFPASDKEAQNQWLLQLNEIEFQTAWLDRIEDVWPPK